MSLSLQALVSMTDTGRRHDGRFFADSDRGGRRYLGTVKEKAQLCEQSVILKQQSPELQGKKNLYQRTNEQTSVKEKTQLCEQSVILKQQSPELQGK